MIGDNEWNLINFHKNRLKIHKSIFIFNLTQTYAHFKMSMVFSLFVESVTVPYFSLSVIIRLLRVTIIKRDSYSSSSTVD